MKTKSEFLVVILMMIFSVQIVRSQPSLPPGKLIPVYPGAELKTAIDPGDSKLCCNFLSKDNFDKVVAFYENSLKIKPLDANGLAVQYPFLKPQTDLMLKEMPYDLKIRFYVLQVIDFQGQKGAEIFEVNTSQKGVEFSIMESQLEEKDMHYASEWIGGKETITLTGDNSNLLASALPSWVPDGYEKGDLYSDPIQTSISYSKLKKKSPGSEGDDSDAFYEIYISISDQKGNSEFTDSMINPEAEYEKAVRVKGKYAGKESIEKNEYGCLQSSKVFLVNERFLVEVTASLLCDLSLIDQVIDKMNLDILPK